MKMERQTSKQNGAPPSPKEATPPSGSSGSLDGEPLGLVIEGSLTKGLTMRLAPDKSVEDLRAGTFLVVQGERNRFFALLSDVELASIHKDVLLNPPTPEERLRRAVLAGTSAYGLVHIRPMVMLAEEVNSEGPEALLSVRTVPTHFSPVYRATREDVSRVFGAEGEGRPYYFVGTPLDMDTPVCIHLDRWVERSNAIFGKSGTGKTFLTRLCIFGVIKAKKAVHLIFDMHNEYAWEGRSETNAGRSVRGLKQYFNSQVLIATLDRESSIRRGVRPDFDVKVAYKDIEIEDILLLKEELNLTDTALETCYILEKIFDRDWFARLLDMGRESLEELCEKYNVHFGAVSALQRKLQMLPRRCGSFLVPYLPPEEDPVNRILAELQRGKHIVLEFGRNDSRLQYMLVANILTRRLHSLYIEKMEKYLGGEGEEPKPLIIVVEEAHKFLTPEMAHQTIFGTIAREMRKYNVTLLIVDQRPSQIDRETLSQVGTRICCLLDDEQDVMAALAGMPNSAELRTVLAGLETRQQALLFGHAVPMPVVVQTRTYDDDTFRKAMNPANPSSILSTAERDRDFPF